MITILLILKGKTYHESNIDFLSAEPLEVLEKEILDRLSIQLPTSNIPEWSGITNPALYGINTHAEFLNPRQRIVICLLLQCLTEEFVDLEQNHSNEVAKSVIGPLSCLIDQLVDWNCRLSVWISENEQVGRAFSGPGIPMMWDYAEIDPLLDGPANLWSKLDRIVAGLESIPKFPILPQVQKGCAQNLPFPDEFFDAVITDPPYYDNIFYCALSDFIYSWKRPIMNLITPHFTGESTDASVELVASKHRNGDQSHSEYCKQFTLALSQAERVMKASATFALMYSHSSIQGWMAIVQSYRSTNLYISSAEPLSIERRQRPRAMSSEAVNTCVVLISRKVPSLQREILPTADLHNHLFELTEKLAVLLANGWAERDVGLALFANGVSLLANSCGLQDRTDKEALIEVEQYVHSKFASFKLKKRKTL